MVYACVSVLSRMATCVEARGPLLAPFSISLYVLETGSPTVSDGLAGQCATRVCLFLHPASLGLPVHSATHCVVCVLGGEGSKLKFSCLCSPLPIEPSPQHSNWWLSTTPTTYRLPVPPTVLPREELSFIPPPPFNATTFGVPWG